MRIYHHLHGPPDRRSALWRIQHRSVADVSKADLIAAIGDLNAQIEAAIRDLETMIEAIDRHHRPHGDGGPELDLVAWERRLYRARGSRW
jgi:hypothetical protein